MKQELIKNSTVSKFENIAGQKILVNKGQFWIQTQRQGHSLHYIVPYQACFAPQIPEFFIKNWTSWFINMLGWLFCRRTNKRSIKNSKRRQRRSRLPNWLWIWKKENKKSTNWLRQNSLFQQVRQHKNAGKRKYWGLIFSLE